MSADYLNLDEQYEADIETAIEASLESKAVSESKAIEAVSETTSESKTVSDSKTASDTKTDHPVIVLISKDGEPYVVRKNNVMVSGMIESTLKNDPECTEIKLNVKGRTLGDIVGYMDHYDGKTPVIMEPPLRSPKLSDVCDDPFDAKFIDGIADEDMQLLYDLLNAANYMDMQALLHLGAAKVASLIKKKTPEEVERNLRPKSFN